MTKELSIVIPAYNEELTIENRVESIAEELKDLDYELIIVEDGTDSTEEKASELEERFSEVKHMHFNRRLGKGGALNKGLNNSNGEIIGFIDSDNSIKPEEITKLYEDLISGNKDVAIGSRYLKDSKVDRKISRLLPSLIYNFIARKLLGTSLQDHQCGIKLFRRSSWQKVSNSISETGWFWDTATLYHIKERNLDIEEIGIEWEEIGSSEIDILSNGFVMGEKLLDLGFKNHNIPVDVNFFRFALIGGLGAILNTSLLYFLTEFLDIYYIYSAIIAVEAAIVLMFFLNNTFTFENTKKGRSIISGIVKSNIVRSFGIATSILILYVLTEYFNILYIVSNILAIFIGSIVNFVGEREFNWN